MRGTLPEAYYRRTRGDVKFGRPQAWQASSCQAWCLLPWQPYRAGTQTTRQLVALPTTNAVPVIIRASLFRSKGITKM